MSRPNTFIVGAPKCGTTAWVAYLRTHPDVTFSTAKEPHYFSTDLPGFRWATDQRAYEALFEGADTRVIAEASVQYLHSHDAAANISAYAPDAKILIFLRDQATFLPSYHNQLLRNLDEDDPDFAAVWRSTLDGARENLPATCREPRLLDYPAVGAFADQVQRYLDAFDRSQVKVLRYEEWTRAPRETYLEVLRFLGLEDDGRAAFDRVHGAGRNRSTGLAKVTQRPPRPALAAARMLRKLTGRKRLGLARLIRRANSATGYGSGLEDGLREELQAYFATDNARLEGIVNPQSYLSEDAG